MNTPGWGFIDASASQVLAWVLASFFIGLALVAAVSAASRAGRLQIAAALYRGVAAIAERLDQAEVFAVSRLVVPVVEHGQKWMIMSAALAVVALIGAYAPAALALAVLTAALFWCLLLYRLWSSDEEDRAIGNTAEKRIQLSNVDMTGFIWVVALSSIIMFPLIFYQVDILSRESAFIVPVSYSRPSAYLLYFLAELQKLAPIAREGGLVHAQLFSGINAVHVWGISVTLAFRIFGDVLILAVLLKLADVAMRMSRGIDLRRQTERLESGDIGKGLRAVRELRVFSVRRGRLNALALLRNVATGSDYAKLPLAVRAAACDALRDAAPSLPLLARQMLETAQEGYRILLTEEGEGSGERAGLLHNQGNGLFDLGALLGGEDCVPFLRAAIETLEASIALREGGPDPIGWADAQNSLGSTYRALSEHLADAEALAALAAAESAYASTLTVRTRHDYPDRWAAAKANLAGALHRKGEREASRRVKVETFQATEACLREALDVQAAPGKLADRELANTYNGLGNVLWRLGQQLPEADQVHTWRQSEHYYRLAMRIAARFGDHTFWSAISSNLANVFMDTAAVVSEDEAFDAFESARELYDQALVVQRSLGLLRSNTLHNKGNMLVTLGGRQKGAARADTFREAIRCAEAALEVRTEAYLTAESAQSQNLLARAFRMLATELDAPENVATLERAIAAARRALQLQAAGLVDWAMTQRVLGDALRVLSALQDGQAAFGTLDEAVAAFEAAAAVFSQEVNAREWVRTERALAAVLSTVAERRGGRDAEAPLIKAEIALRAALGQLAPADDLALWAEAQKDLASVISRLADLALEGRDHRLSEAEQLCRSVLTDEIRLRAPEEWAQAKCTLAAVLQRQSSPSDPEAAQSLCTAAENAYNEAAELKLERDDRRGWASIRYNTGALLAHLANTQPSDGRSEPLTRAVQAYQDALGVFSRERDFDMWAQARTNLGNTLRVLALLAAPRDAPALLQASREAYEPALEGLTEDAWPRYWPTININFASTMALLGLARGGPQGLAMLEAAEAAARAAMTDRVRNNLPDAYAAAEAVSSEISGLIEDRRVQS